MRKGRHPTSQVLLKALDGELSPRELKTVRRHLQACWNCRAELSDIERTVHAYAKLTSERASLERPTPPNSWAAFPSRLKSLDEQSVRKSQDTYLDLLRTLFFGRVAFGFQAALIVVFAYLFWARFEKVQVVSASELLRRATRGENAVKTSGQVEGIFQKLDFRLNHKSFIRTVYRDVAHRRRVAQRETLAGEALECRRIMEQAQLSFDEPLSPTKFQRWLESQNNPHSESVAQLQNQFSLTSEFKGGAIQSAELVIRTKDYHAVRERVQFIDNQELEITELAYEIRSPLVDEAPAPILAAHAARTSPRLSPPEVRPAETDQRWREEMDARVILHRAGADLGEQVTLQSVEGELTLSGIVESAERKNELRDAFKGTAGVHFKLQTVAEAAAGLPVDGVPHTIIQNGSQTTPPLFATLMKAAFESDEARQEYVRRLLSLSDQAVSHAFALRQLALRYPPDFTAQLPVDSQQQLREIVQDHLRTLADEQEQLRKLLAPFIEAPPGTLRTPGPVWQPWAYQMVGTLQLEYNDLIALFAGKDGVEKSESEVVRDLKDALGNGNPDL